MKTLNETEKATYRLLLIGKMGEFIESLPEHHHIGYLPDNINELMAQAALTIIETVTDCNIYFEENPQP